MSLKTLFMPAVSERLLSRERLLAKRASAERKRASRRERHEIHYFHQVDDPYSALAATAPSAPRGALRGRRRSSCRRPAAGERRAGPRAARRLRPQGRRASPAHRGGCVPGPGRTARLAPIERATAVLVAAVESRRFIDVAEQVSAACGGAPRAGSLMASGEAVRPCTSAAQRRCERASATTSAPPSSTAASGTGASTVSTISRSACRSGRPAQRRTRPHVPAARRPERARGSRARRPSTSSSRCGALTRRSSRRASSSSAPHRRGGPAAVRAPDGHARPRGAAREAHVHRERRGARGVRAEFRSDA